MDKKENDVIKTGLGQLLSLGQAVLIHTSVNTSHESQERR